MLNNQEGGLIMKRKIYQTPELNRYEEMGECLMLIGTTIPVVPSEEGSQADAESKPSGDYFEEVDKSIRSYEHNPLEYLPDYFRSVWAED